MSADPAASAVIDAIVAATTTAFEELCQTPVVPGEPDHTRGGPAANWVAAEITLRRTVPGRLLVAFPRPVLETLARRYLPEGTEITPEIADDAAGEFANVIAGQTKTMLKGTPYHFHLSTPRVGPGSPTPSETADVLTVPFDSDAGRFTVLVRLPPCEEAR